jgi:cytochrome c553
MKLNRKRATLGLVALGLAGGLAGGGVALAAATDTTPAASTTSTSPVSAGYCGGMHGSMFGKNSPMSAVASYLGLSQAELRTQMHAGKSLADIAKAQGKSVSGLKDAMVTAMKTNLDANTALTAKQKAAIHAQMNSHLDAMLTMTHPPGMDMDVMGTHMGTHRGGMMSR